MSASVSITDAQLFTAMRSFLMAYLPTGVEVVQGQDNRVPEPIAADFVEMTALFRGRLSTNVSNYQDNPATPSLATQTIEQGTKVTIQLDVHGPNSADNTQIISTLFRDEIGCEAFAAVNPNIQPLYADEPRQLAFINGEQQFENRWIIDCHIQTNPVVTIPQQFAGALKVGLISVDAIYPPGEN